MTLEILKLLIPIVAITMGCSIPLMAIYTEHRKRKELFQLYHQERMAAIEKGIELPPLPEGFFAPDGKPPKPRSPHHDLQMGLFLLCIGTALMTALYFDGRGTKALYALIPIFWGLGALIYYFTVGKKEAEAVEAERKAKAAEISRGSLL